MKLLLKASREGLGRLIVLIDWIFSPKKVKRTQTAQAEINKQVESLKLYQFYACPFCIKTRRVIKRLNLPMETRNAQAGQFRAELLAGGGEVKVPCLRVKENDNITWMYESSDIIVYLDKRFG
ncbi:Glutaredoxin [hydrothermal vent metagenome]|jgi:glutaredoxin|uniref:Glutaredoxin n=1 Tax=hydrothermal vent metagenome TaxID=652676 RepID=A0A1W1DBX5_9ZZZZ